MVACMCKGVTDGELRRTAASGASLEEVVRATGVGTDCGCCVEAVRRVVADASARADAGSAPRAAPRPASGAHGSGGCRAGEPPCPGCARVGAAAPLALTAA